jgi:hypothetical protein
MLLFAACTNGGEPGRSPGAAELALIAGLGDIASRFSLD